MKRLLVTMLALVAAASLMFGNENELKVFTWKNPGFSFKYPHDWKRVPTKGENEVARYSARNLYKVPVLVANVYSPDGEFDPDRLADDTIDRLSTSAPGVSDFRVTEQKTLELKDGSEGHFLKMGWTWADGKTRMETVSLSSFKDGKIVSLSATAFEEQKLTGVLEYLCRTLSMSREK